MSSISFAVDPNKDHPDTVEVVPVVDDVPLTDRIHAFERVARMEAGEASYGGLIPAFFKFGPASVHYMASRGAFLSKSGKIPLLGCECGEWGCWPLLATVASSTTEVRWSDFEQPFRTDRDYSGFGSFVFSRNDYEMAVRELSPVWDRARGVT